MTLDRSRPMRVVVCGTIFGQVYLEAFRLPDMPFVLAGILSQGSERSRQCAERHGVPLFTDPDQLPADVDAACVVIRSGLLGGRGTAVAEQLMARGIHVIQEHPLHHDELAACLRCARRHHVVYHLNSFYIHLEPVRRFLGAAQELMRQHRPLYVDASCGFQVAFALLDVIGRTLGTVRPWALADVAPLPERVRASTDRDFPFRGMDGVIGGVPLTLRVQNQLDPGDPDSYAHLLHRITVGTEAGSLTLTDSHGPALWCARPRFPRHVRSGASRPHFAGDTSEGGASPREVPIVEVLGPAVTPGYGEAFQHWWPRGVARALSALREAILGEEDAAARGQYYLTLCQLWQEITARLGPPELVHAQKPRALTPEDLRAVDRAGHVASAPAAVAG